MPKLIRVCELVRHWLECSTDTEMQPHDSNSHTRFSSYLAFSKNTTSPRAGVLCRALSPDQPRRPVTDSFILLMNHLCAPPRPAFTHTRASVVSFYALAASLSVSLLGGRRAVTFAWVLLEATRRGGPTRDHHKTITCVGETTSHIYVLK